jgi:hypothetical protein
MNGYIKTAQESYAPISRDIATVADKVFDIRKGESLSTKAKFRTGVTIAGATTLAIASPYALAVTFGMASLGMNYKATQSKDHDNLLATASIAICLGLAEQAIYFGLTGGVSLIPGMAMLAHAAITTAAFCCIPENKADQENRKPTDNELFYSKLRKSVAIVGGTVGAAVAGYAALSFNEVADGINAVTPYFLAATTAFNAFVFGIGTSRTERARQCYIGLNGAHALYWLTQPIISLGMVATELLFMGGHIKSIFEKDVPMTDPKYGETLLNASERRREYWNLVWNGRNDGNKSKSREDLKNQHPSLN